MSFLARNFTLIIKTLIAAAIPLLFLSPFLFFRDSLVGVVGEKGLQWLGLFVAITVVVTFPLSLMVLSNHPRDREGAKDGDF